MRTSEQVKAAINRKIDQAATAIDCSQEFVGLMVRVTFNRKNGKIRRVFLSHDSETEYETEDKR